MFTTTVPIEKSAFPIDYDSKILSLGSCFAKNMGEKFGYFKFQSGLNPFGIIFNPVSIEKLIRRSIRKDYFTEKDIFFYNDLWHCFEVHSELSHSDKTIFLNRLNQMIEQSNNQIIEASHIIITLGTAWVYRSIEKGEIVANCHKVPQKEFEKELLSVEVIQNGLEGIVEEIAAINKEAKFIFTVSPVRHIKDGFVENQRSKAHLIAALGSFRSSVFRFQSADDVNEQPPTTNYFPSYEIMMDELRDYRFYANDMLHPSEVAIEYIWERFRETAIAESAYKTMEQVSVVQKGMGHRPFNPDSESHLKFLKQLEQKKNKLVAEFPFMKF